MTAPTSLRFIGVASLFALATLSGNVYAITARVEPQRVRHGEAIRALLDVSGRVGIESDLMQASTMATVTAGSISIGEAKHAGLYFVLVKSGQNATMIAVMLTDDGADHFAVESIALTDRDPTSTPAPAGVSDALLSRFADAISKDNYAAAKRAAQNAAKKFVASNASGLTGTITICILPIPGSQAICLARVGDHLIDLGFEFTNALIDEAPGLSPAEQQKLRNFVQAGRTIIDATKLLRADRSIEKLIVAASTGANLTSFVVKNQRGDDVAVSVISNNMIGLVDKTAITIKLVTK